ncbi:IMS domain-containing protein [Thermosynechococcus sp. HY213]|uniref:IMS domain-containing protein n=1 Tax=Thermosynechococcus sp. HY213 TaxID=3074104 RepID=UPI00285A9B4D|nr:IMS domain-containing protein [Thermosynechococcus sp. HY213]MDR7920799.1 IMS domain-containing protein [Thermosynechococcus sp. HY213]
MRIPLDYYQVLGVPIQATPEQIEQAFQDRLLQLPTHQHSPTTVATRRELIEQAYAVLREPEQRHAYDRHCCAVDPNDLIAQLDPDATAPHLEISDQQFSGALLLLYELGNYSQVVKLGEQFLKEDAFDLNRPYTSSAAVADITLTVALAYLELGREEWQRQSYQAAASRLEAGLEVLQRANLFPDLQEQLETELHRLRPYRILELLALPLSDSVNRQRGILLLREMLSDRGGIEGRHDDHSGLGVEDFLKFILQLRSHLTVAEQQELFERESRRPSAVATYLAVHALVARGVQELQPSYIRRAKNLLERLSPNQDIYLELASCLLLLGQPAEALAALDKSQDQQSLAFIRRHSHDSSDLLPGLYYYTEQWLREEIYPAFRDLGETPVALDAYFADPDIQTYLEALSDDSFAPEPPSTTASALPEVIRPTVAVPPPVSFTAETLPLEYHTGLGQGFSAAAATRSSTATETDTPPASTRKRRRPPTSHHKKRQTWFWMGAGVVLVGLGALAKVYWPAKTAEAPPPPPPVTPTPTPVATPTPTPQPTTLATTLTPEMARDRLRTWQQIKAQALGTAFEMDKLATILAEPELSRWRSRAQSLKSEGSHWVYTLRNLEVKEVRPRGSDRVDVLVEVNEDARFYEQGTLRNDISYSDPYRVIYTFTRRGNQWLIQRMQVVS